MLWISLGSLSIGGAIIPFRIGEHRVEAKNIFIFHVSKVPSICWIQYLVYEVEVEVERALRKHPSDYEFTILSKVVFESAGTWLLF